ncbi:MAG: FAD-dependent thymidylate synthase [Anaerolineales bacterium]|nr:FAD-dependent thymidylate synthase [Anaerolineales bacterium]
MTTNKRTIYLLNPRDYSPELIAVAFAKTSRSPLSFLTIAEELNAAASAQFHEKWVVGYGHASVAEHAVLHLALENVSRLAVETIESNRLASYTEKSTRYQKWDADSFYTPVEILESAFTGLYLKTVGMMFAAYNEVQAPVRSVIAGQYPQRRDETQEQWDRRIRSRYIDSCRFLLPAASLANVGMTINARMLEHALCKMLSHPLEEVRSIGEEIKRTALEEVPTLLKYTEASSYHCLVRNNLQRVPLPEKTEPEKMVQLLDFEKDAEEKVLAAALYEYSDVPFNSALLYIRSLEREDKAALVEKILRERGRHDAPPRSLEHASYMFEVVVDQGAYFELKRHRIMTQTPQPMTVNAGYAAPRLLSEAGVDDRYCQVMDQVAEVVETIASWNPEVAAYLIPNGFNRRVLMTLNLRELFHLCELRAAANAHYSVRRIAYRMVELVRQVHPLLAGYIRLPEGESWQTIERENLTNTGLQ